MNFHYSQLEATFGTKFINIRDKKFCANSWRLLHRLNTPLGQLPWSQADRLYLNAGGIRFNNQSRKGRVATKSRRRLFEDTAFSEYLDPTKCCNEALNRGDVTVLKKCVRGRATNIRVRGTVRFMSKNLTPVSCACRIHNSEGVTVWIFDLKTKQYVRCLF